MGSTGRFPPVIRFPLHGPGIVHPDPFAPGMRPPHGSFPHFDMLPPPEVLEQKLATQHVEMQKLATENQRLAAIHGSLRHELAAAQHELQMLCAHMGALKSERDQQMRGLLDNIAKMEAELQGADALKVELQKARADAQSLHSAKQELVTKVQLLTQDIERAHSDMQQIPAMMSELETLRQEYQGCRATYDYEKKLFYGHLESLQEMEKNYITMATEVEKLRAELTNSANIDARTGGVYGGTTGYNDNDATGHYPVGQNVYGDDYGAPQGNAPFSAGGVAAAGGGVTHVGAQSESATARAGYDAQRGLSGTCYDSQREIGGPGYDAQRGLGGPGYDAERGLGGPGYDTQRGPGGPGYDAQRGPGGPGYDIPRGPAYDAQRGSPYDTQKGPVYDPHRGSGFDGHRGPAYEAQSGPGHEAREPGYDVHRGSNFDTSKDARYDASGPQGQVALAGNASYGSTPPPTRAGGGFGAPPRGGNPARR